MSNVDNFAMKSENSTAQIRCVRGSHICFNQSWFIHITNLEFFGCGGNQVKYLQELVVEDTKFEGQENSGTALELIETTALIVNCTFVSNKRGSYRNCLSEGCEDAGYIGGAIIATNSTLEISQSKFEDNRADFGGTIFAEQNSIINMNGNDIVMNNTATYIGGVLYSYNSTIIINVSIFQNNIATYKGGALSSYNSTIMIEASEFDSNRARQGGVLSSYSSTISIEASEFHDNSATIYYGGVLYSSFSTITIGGSNFTKNNSPIGAVIYARAMSDIQYHGYLQNDNNLADNYAVVYLSDSEFRGHVSGNATFSNNSGSLMAFNSNITFSGYTIFMNNRPSQAAYGAFQEGGAMTLFQSNIYFDGECTLEHNHAENGGAILSTDSKLYVNDNVTIAHNTATDHHGSRNGGGISFSNSELYCQQKSTMVLLNNTAAFKGGGLHAISSSIKATSKLVDTGGDYLNSTDYRYIGARINLTNNLAKWGGGLSLQASAKLYILKYDVIHNVEIDTNTMIFTANRAEYGGAIYVDDTSSGTCGSDPKTECFFQVLALYDDENPDISHIKTQCVYFSQNYANNSGSTLYGGLLDRCAVNQFAEYYKRYAHDSKDIGGGIAYFNNVSTTINTSISSGPVRVCLCHGIHDCNHTKERSLC